MTTHQAKLAQNLAEIEAGLRTREPSFTPSDQYAALTEGSGAEAQEALLAIKRANPSATPLTTLVYQFHHKIAADNNKQRALTEILMKTAVPQSLALDRTVSDANRADYPLYGFVLSLKECFKKRGTKSTAGMFIMDYVCQEDVPFIEYLEAKGAVFPVKSNVPQLLFAMESCNNIYGDAQNPWDPTRTCGGSSGGDGCLVALKQVYAGLGSDIAGSARIPAAFCGVNSIMFSPSRIDRSAHVAPFEGCDFFPKMANPQFGIRATFGLTGRSVKDMTILSKVVLEFYKERPRLPPVAWKEVSADTMSKKVGVILEWDNLMELTATNRRAMETARSFLASRGYTLVDIDLRAAAPELMTWIPSIFHKNNMLIDVLKGAPDIKEPLIPAFDSIIQARKTPRWLLKILSRVYPDAKARCFINGALNGTHFNTDYIMEQIWRHRTALLDRMKAEGIEVLLCPSMMPASFTDKSTNLFPWVTYLNTWNAFGWTAGHFTVTRVRPEEQTYVSRFEGKMETAVRELMRGAAGLPVGIQVVAPEWQDEKVLAMMRLLQEGIPAPQP